MGDRVGGGGGGEVREVGDKWRKVVGMGAKHEGQGLSEWGEGQKMSRVRVAG